MRYTGVFGRTALVLVAVIMAVTLLAGSAHAAVVTTTQTFVNRFGNTVTVTTTWVDGDLSSQTYKEVSPAGVVVTDRSITYWLDGDPNQNLISHYEEYRTIGGYQNTIIRDYDQYGNVIEQYAKIAYGGVTIGEQYVFYQYDAYGNLVYEERRTMGTLPDGTIGWIVDIWQNGVWAPSAYYPYDHDFNATLPERPGYGYGDENHEHSGPPGQDAGSSAGGANGSGMSDPLESRPGYGHGDENHEHSGGKN